MAKTSKKALGATMAGVMAVGAVAGVVGAIDQVKVANAAESQALKNAKAKISHLSWSVQNNYLGIKNQAQWEVYIKEARGFIAQMPKAEALQAQGLTSDVDKIAGLVQAVARVNHVEKSMETNFKGIKNAETWRGYLDNARIDIAKVDVKKFPNEIAKITERMNKASDEVTVIEKAFDVEYNKVVEAYNAVNKTKNLDEAKKVLVEAEKLGTCKRSDDLEASLKKLISEIESAKYILNSADGINSRKVEIKFNKAVSDASSIARDGDRIIIVKAGDSINDSSVTKIKSTTITFSSDDKTATAVLDRDIETGVNYTVHLVSTDKKESLASVNSVLLGGSSSPGVDVKEGDDKVILKYSDKMRDTALNLSYYEIFDSNGKKISDPFSKAEWVDKVDKKEVKFTVKPGALKAGEKYKIEINAREIKTDNGRDLSNNQKVVEVRTPSLDSSRPVVKNAYINDGRTLTVKFDRDLYNTSVSKDLIKVERNDGKTISVNSASIRSDDTLEISVDDKSFIDGENYKVTLQSNTVLHDVFRNAGNASGTTSIGVAEAKAVTSVKAKFVNNKGDLELTFDRAVKNVDTSKLTIESQGKSTSLSSAKFEIATSDSSNRTAKITGIDKISGLDIKSNENYKIIVERDAVTTGSVTEIKNKEKLTDTITGVNTGSPAIDKITLDSAERITVKFDRSINASGLSASDVSVKGYIKTVNDNGATGLRSLSGSNQIKVSYSGDSVTITPANDSIKFATGKIDDIVVFDKETIKDANNSSKSNSEKLYGTRDKTVDNAEPVILAANVNGSNGLKITYTEDVRFKNNDDKAANQFTVERVERDASATRQYVSGNIITLTFDSTVFDTSKNYSDAKVTYKSNTSYGVKDEYDNVAANVTITGIHNGNPSTNPGDSKQDAKDAANRAIAKLADYAKTNGVTAANKAEAEKAVKAANDAAADYLKYSGTATTDLTNYADIKKVEDAIKALPLGDNELKGSFGNILGADYVDITLPVGKTVTSVKVDGTETAKSNYNVDEGVLTILKVKDTNKIEITTNDGAVYTVVK